MMKFYKLKRFLEADKGGAGKSTEQPKEELLDEPTKTVESVSDIDTLYKDLGVNSKQELEAALQLAKDLQDADKTNSQKLEDKVNSLTSNLADADTKNENLVNEIKALVIDNKIIQKLNGSKLKFHNPDKDVLPQVRQLVSLDDDGNVSGITEALESIAEENPHYLKNKTGGNDTKEHTKTGKMIDNDFLDNYLNTKRIKI